MGNAKAGTKRTKKSDDLAAQLDKIRKEESNSTDVVRPQVPISRLGWDNTHRCPEYKIIKVARATDTGDPKKVWVILHLMECVSGKLEPRTHTYPINIALPKWGSAENICTIPLPLGHTIGSLMLPQHREESDERYDNRMARFQARIENSVTMMDMIEEELDAAVCQKAYYISGIRVCTWFTTKKPKDAKYAKKSNIDIVDDSGKIIHENVYWSTVIKDDEGKLFESLEGGEIVQADE